MKILVCRPDELGSAEVSLWRAWQRADPALASPFLAPEFAIAMAHHNDAARVAVLDDGNQTVGFLPFERHIGGVGRALGYGLSDSQALIAAPGLEWSHTELLAGCNLATFEFDHLVAGQVGAWCPREVTYHASPVIDLAGGFDTWLAGKRQKSPGRIKKVLQYERKLGREWGEVSFEFDSTSDEDLSRLMRWKGAQYVRTGRSNRFAKSWFRDFVTELFHTRNEHFSMALARLQAGDRPVALHLSLRADTVLAGWFPSYDPEAGAYSPGLACWLSTIRVGREHGLSRVDLGRGDHDYKNLFADHQDQVADGSSERPVRAAVLRRMITAPRRILTDVVLSRPRLRVAARETLAQVGRLRSNLS